MPKTRRDYLKREVAQAYLGLERVMECVHVIEEIFHEPHPDLAIALEVVLQASLASQEILRKFWCAAWGQEDPRWESWI
ncbi:MAG: hypothetical protein KJ604_20780 [Gammaproteobacteria bacterium]|nr:hypothetical protein [Gammaproteobacteria bacterium]